MTVVITRPSAADIADLGQTERRPGWSVDTVREWDRDALHTLFSACSPETVRLRFFGQVPHIPRRYLDEVLTGPPEVHDAVIARCGQAGRVAGLASLAAESEAGPDVAGLGVLVADAWQRQGVGTAMIEALLIRARARGVERVAATVLPGRFALLAALSRRLERDRAYGSADGRTGVYRLIEPHRLGR
jgi:GNAT superfamily N-acetyltransferase